jgi:hypothetical protein
MEAIGAPVGFISEGGSMTSTSPARILRAAPYFLVPDVAAAGTYYREVLGFQCEYAAGEPEEWPVKRAAPGAPPPAAAAGS